MSKVLPMYTLEDVSKHNEQDDCWVAIEDKVYNITNWLKKHPGGTSILFNLAGQDCTDEFKIFHLKPNYGLLKAFVVGDLAEKDVKKETAVSKDLNKLHDKFKSEGLFEPDYWFYVTRAAIILSLFAVSMYLFSIPSMWACLMSAIFLGAAWQQLAFVGHDIGHHVLTHNQKLDDMFGIIFGNAIQGISLEWWKHSHNTHHSVTNSVSHDPDIQHLPFMAINREFLESVYSTYHKRKMDFDKAGEFFVSKQHYLFYLIMALARFNLYAQSWIFNIVGPGSKSKRRNTELASLLFFLTWFITLLSYSSSWLHALVFLLVSHAVAGIVHVQICINHFPMDTYHGVPQRAFPDDGYLMSQLTTTRNIECVPFMDFFHGGLQFQIEHHIFPHLTRSKLRYVQTHLKELCAKHNLPYQSVPFWKANWDVLVRLYETSKDMKIADIIIDGLNMNG